jgi:hypothetical protein
MPPLTKAMSDRMTVHSAAISRLEKMSQKLKSYMAQPALNQAHPGERSSARIRIASTR